MVNEVVISETLQKSEAAVLKTTKNIQRSFDL